MFLVVFRNRKRAGIDLAAYQAEAARMEALAAMQPGFLSFRSYAAEDGETVAISEWESEKAAKGWGRHEEHRMAQARGRGEFYESYTLFACADPRVTRFDRSET